MTSTSPIIATDQCLRNTADTQPGLPKGIWSLLFIVAAFATLSPDRALGWYGTAVLWLIAKLLWRPGQPQTLFLIVLFQWAQSFGPVLQSLLDGRPYAEMMVQDEMETAAWLSLTGVGVLALGIKLTTRHSESTDATKSLRGLARLDGLRLLLGWGTASLVTTAVRTIGAFYAPVVQAFSALEMWKWAMVLLIFYRWTATGKGAAMAVGILIFESAIGMLGIFSSFKTVFILLIIAGTGMISISKHRAALLMLFGVVMVFFLGFWQVVKGYYRSYMSDGERAQVITVSMAERAAWMGEAVNLVGMDHLEQGWQDGLRRLSYVDFFGYAIKTVPQVVKHTDGELWMEAITHTLRPRFLFPDKAPIDDSARTNAYCGVTVTGAESGTSISIGYMGESYIDFGQIGMFVPIFLWGALMGWTYHWLRKNSGSMLLGVGLGTGLLLLVGLLLESSNLKMLGGLIVAFVGLVISVKLLGRGLWYWLICADKRSPALLTGRSINARDRAKLHTRNSV